MNNYFDKIIASDEKITVKSVKNLSSLIFNQLIHRDENSDVILSHDGTKLVKISLKRLRFVVYSLFNQLEKKKIKPGQTVLLASISGNNELFIALMFTALSAYGVRVLLPMFMEINALEEWLDMTGCSVIILPGEEILSLNHHEKEKSIVHSIKKIALQRKLPCFDILKDFSLRKLLYQNIPDISYSSDIQVRKAVKSTTHETEAMLISTSGSSGKSKLVVYEQGAFIRSCLSWQAAGFFTKEKLGGRGFTPLFTHTMGVRAYFNAIWTGIPVCLINTEWFEEKPEIVRYFLLQMNPEHITGGPSVFNLLLELMRNFPELKNRLGYFMKTVVSSGAPNNCQTAKAIETAFGLTMHNAFGMTETQQILSTLIFNKLTQKNLKSLGLPLPGVTIGLKKMPEENGHYRLYVNSPFGFKKIIGEPPSNDIPKDFFNTGDIVSLDEKNRIIYQGRENRDFVKDGFGVKIPLNCMRQHYEKLYSQAEHVEYFPIKNSPGMTAMIFIQNDSLQKGKVTDNQLIQQYSRLISEMNDQLYKKLEPFEFRHRFLSRFVLINSDAPKTVKGNISKYKIETNFQDVIEALIDPLSSHSGVENTESREYIVDKFTRYLNPYIGGMLSQLKMDYVYHRAKKDKLYSIRDGKKIEILDFVGGYGTNLLGHNNDELKAAVTSFLRSDRIALSDQGSIQEHAGELAEKLNTIVGEITGREYNVMFGSSGAEAVEMALHHAAFEWRKNMEKLEQQQFQHLGDEADRLIKEVWEENRKILQSVSLHVLTLKNAFHGNSSGARSLLGNKENREMFSNITGVTPIFVDDQSPNWKEELEDKLNRSKIEIKKVVFLEGKCRVVEILVSTVIASIIEPIVGEGGVREVNSDFLQHLTGYEFPLIMDEIQCGLGRAGSFLASEGIKADYYLFAKALGGNYEKISAVLIDKNRYKKEFGKLYVSTFSNGGLAAKVGLKVLSIIKKNKVPELARTKGDKLLAKLKKVQEKYPSVIAEITGRGLIQGIKFNDFSESNNIFLRIMFSQRLSGYIFSSYLLNKHRIRILPTLSAPNILRIEPSAYINDGEIDRFVKAVEDLAHQIENQKIYDLFLPLMDDDSFNDNKGKKAKPGPVYSRLDEPCDHTTKVAFIGHFVRPTQELRMLEKEFLRASDTGLRILFNRMQFLMEMKPFVLFAKNLFCGRIHFSFIILPLDSAQLERLHRQGKRRQVVAKIQDAVNLAASRGATVISLGGYTSILSQNGTSIVEPKNTKIITGNTLTAASGIHRIIEEIRNREEFRKKNRLGIIGASGNIGSIIVERLSRSDDLFEKIILINKNKRKLEHAVNNLRAQKCSLILEMETDLHTLKQCDIIAVATNTNDPIIFPHHLKDNEPVLISDLSVPSAVSNEVAKMKNVITISFASYIALPEDPDFIISSYTPKGSVFCCAAEAFLCGLEAIDVPLRGKITPEAIDIVTTLAKKHHFFEKLGTIQSFKLGT